MGRIKSKEVKIYAPAGFKATWQTYLEICDRDNTNASREIRKFVERQVKMRAPGNPQPPLTAFFEGHDDKVLRTWSTTIKDLVAYAEKRGGELTFRDILKELKGQGLDGYMLATRAGSMEKTLKSLGVTVWH